MDGSLFLHGGVVTTGDEVEDQGAENGEYEPEPSEARWSAALVGLADDMLAAGSTSSRMFRPRISSGILE